MFWLCRKSTFEKTYSNNVFPTNGPQLWSMIDHIPIYLSLMRQEIDRLRKMRNKTDDESRNPHMLSRRLSIICRKYGETGHNKMSCKEKRATYRIMPNGGNKTKKAKTNKGG